MELKIIYEHEEMRDMVVHVNTDGMQKNNANPNG